MWTAPRFSEAALSESGWRDSFAGRLVAPSHDHAAPAALWITLSAMPADHASNLN